MTAEQCRVAIFPRIGPFRFRLHCTLKPNHEAIGLPDHKWVKEFDRLILSATGRPS